MQSEEHVQIVDDNSPGNFLNFFNISGKDFIDPVQMEDSKIGFSVKRKYDESLLKKLKIPKNAPFVCLIHVIVQDDDYKTKDLIPIKFKASFGYSHDGSLRAGIKYLENGTFFYPLDIESKDEFFFNKTTNKFFYKKKNISPSAILDAVFEMHIKITKPIKGSWLRIKFFWYMIVIPFLFKSIKKICRILHSMITFEKYNYIMLLPIDGLSITRTQDSEKAKGEIDSDDKKVKIFGYNINPNPLLTYCMTNLFFYTIYYFFPLLFGNFIVICNYISRVSKNNFLIVLYVVFTLYIWDVTLPCILKRGIKYFEEKGYSSKFYKIRI